MIYVIAPCFTVARNWAEIDNGLKRNEYKFVNDWHQILGIGPQGNSWIRINPYPVSTLESNRAHEMARTFRMRLIPEYQYSKRIRGGVHGFSISSEGDSPKVGY